MEENIITFQMLGGLGNILFPFAAALSLSKDHDLKLKINYDHVGKLHTDPIKYKNIFFETFETIKTTECSSFKIEKEKSFIYNEVQILKKNNYFLSGYFQSHKYFEHNKDFIQKKMSPSNDLIDHLLQKYPFLKEKNNVSVHFRRGDYLLHQETHTNLKIEYYEKALQIIKPKKIIVFSDDIDYVKKNLSWNNLFFIKNNNDYEDLFAMSLCDNNIIANSTFSWWSAWLNTNEQKKIVAPLNWFGNSFYKINLLTQLEVRNSLFPKDWIII